MKYIIVSIRPLLFDQENPYLDIAQLNITYIIFLTKIKGFSLEFLVQLDIEFWLFGWTGQFYWKYINYFVYEGVTCYLQKLKTVRKKCPKAYLVTFKDTLEAYF